ncbi:hypothetical protein HY797_01950 [Candidatus Falkowbacteria bacterium]|nr:hypothetical protein [Candidatus Falkowbacteria bacterium]
MIERPCYFLDKGCAFGAEGACIEKEAGGCGESIRRKILAQQPCPVMENLGYSGQLAECDCPELRAQVPSGEPCHFDGKCIRELNETVQSLLNTRKERPFKELRKPIVKTLKTIQAQT